MTITTNKGDGPIKKPYKVPRMPLQGLHSRKKNTPRSTRSITIDENSKLRGKLVDDARTSSDVGNAVRQELMKWHKGEDIIPLLMILKSDQSCTNYRPSAKVLPPIRVSSTSSKYSIQSINRRNSKTRDIVRSARLPSISDATHSVNRSERPQTAQLDPKDGNRSKPASMLSGSNNRSNNSIHFDLGGGRTKTGYGSFRHAIAKPNRHLSLGYLNGQSSSAVPSPKKYGNDFNKDRQ